jgi:L-lactate dehydrogenase complex protein LldE
MGMARWAKPTHSIGDPMYPKRVTLFVQCLVDGIYPQVAEAMVQVFKHLGIAVDCPEDQTCCGQPAFNSGYRSAAKRAAAHFLDVFAGDDTIVCPSGSCVAMVRHHYPELFADDERLLRRAHRVGRKTFEFSQYLVDVLGVDDLGARFNGIVTYHDSCHLLRHLGIATQPRRLIGKVQGARLVEMTDADHCCGFGGTFAIKYPQISTAMVDDKVANILATGADAVIGCDISCLMNIQGRLSRLGSPVKTMHIAQLLAAGRHA